MTTWSTRRALERTGRVLFAAMAALAVGAAVHGRQAQAPSPPQTPAVPPAGPAGQPGQPVPGGRRGPAPEQGPVLGRSGEVIGFTNLAEIPGTTWKIHDAARPQPRVVAAGVTPGAPPSDAIVLFDGKDLSKWAHLQNGQLSDARWPIRDGFFETAAGTGPMVTREPFGNVQLHVEFATPGTGRGASQSRGNSGVIFMGLYEVQVLDSYDNVTYADGHAGSIYGEHPPLVNVARKPGEWQTFDIMFEAPKFNGTTLVTPAYITVIWNGVLVQHRRSVMGATSGIQTSPHTYTAHEAERPLTLQPGRAESHMQYRNIWIRRLAGYDQPEQRLQASR